MTDTPDEHAGAADLSLTADIVVAFLGNNKVDPVAVPEVISATHAALVRLTAPQVEATTETAPTTPTRAAIRKSVTEEGIVSFLDGKMYKTLKRHLTTRGYTPDRRSVTSTVMNETAFSSTERRLIGFYPDPNCNHRIGVVSSRILGGPSRQDPE